MAAILMVFLTINLTFYTKTSLMPYGITIYVYCWEKDTGKNCTWVRFLTGRRPISSFSPRAVATMHCPMKVGTYAHSFTCTAHPAFIHWSINHTSFASQLKLVLIYRPRRNGSLSRPGQIERWVKSRPRTATQCLSRLITGQRHSRLTEQTCEWLYPEHTTSATSGMWAHNHWVASLMPYYRFSYRAVYRQRYEYRSIADRC